MVKLESTLSHSKVLVTGANGFIGTAVAKRLHDVGAVVFGTYFSSQPNDNGCIEWEKVNLTNDVATKKVLFDINPDYIIHLAGRSVGAKTSDEINSSLQGNLITTINVLGAAMELDCKKIILSGSMEEPEVTKNEGYPIPLSPYAAAKFAASSYGRMLHAIYDLPIVIARIFMVYGPGQNNNKKLIPYTINSILTGGGLRYSNGLRKIDWIYIDDAVDAIIELLIRPNLLGATIDIGTGFLTSVRATVEKIISIMGISLNPNFGHLEDRPNESSPAANIMDTQNKLNWKARIPLDAGLIETINYYKDLAN